MCPSVRCPNCSKMTYHRGLCENNDCGFDPLSADLDDDFLDKFQAWLSSDEAAYFAIALQEKPFKLVRIIAFDREDVLNFARFVGYPEDLIWGSDYPDLFKQNPESGVDFPKKLADIFQDVEWPLGMMFSGH